MRNRRIIALLGCALVILSGCGRVIDKNSSVFSEKASDTAVTAVQTAVQDDASSADDSSEAASETEKTSSKTEEKTSAETEKPETSAETQAADDSSSQADIADDLSVPYSKAYALYRPDDGMLIAEKSLYDQISLASITKLLSASVMLRYLSPDDSVTVGDEVYLAKPDSTLSYITPGMTLKVKDLIAAMLLPSGNDAAYTVAVNTARTAAGDPYMDDQTAVAYFCDLMNGFAAELGMSNSHFANPEGWDDPEHYTTLGDLLKLADHVLSVPELCEIAGTYQRYCEPETGGSCLWTNTNLFLDPTSPYYREDCIGLKTGTTASAGCCLISAFRINGSTYICAVMGCGENYDRYELAQKILNKYIR